MVNKIVKISLFLLISGTTIIGIAYFNNAFAFDKFESHPPLTDEIVKFYNANSIRKITAEELALMKIGSQKEDNSPRWINHFYDAIHNNGLTTKYLRGAFLGMSWEKALGFSMPKDPLKSIDWVKNENYQLIYGENMTWQKAIRLYFDKKDDGFVALGAILHLLEDLGVPEHSRADGHVDIFSGTFLNNEIPSYYENYAKSLDISSLNTADNLIKNKEQPYNNGSIENIFSNLSSYTANNWFSEDTIEAPEFQSPRMATSIKKGKYTFYYGENKKIIALGVYDSDKDTTTFTTNQLQIQSQWLSTVTPEIVKYGANLINLYFAEIEKMEKDETLVDIDRLEARDRRVKRTLNPAPYISAKILSKRAVWGFADAYHNAKHAVAQIFNKAKNTVQSIDKKLFIAEVNPLKVSDANEINETNNNSNSISDPPEPTIYEESVNQNQILSVKSQNVIQNLENQLLASIKANVETNAEKLINEHLSATQDVVQATKSTFVFTGGPEPTPTPTPQPEPEPAPVDKCAIQTNSSKIIISEIQYETEENTKDEYIELYNPNDTTATLDCFEIVKYTSGSSAQTLIPKSKFEGTIQPHSFFLISHPSVQSKYNSDLTYSESYSFSKNNSIVLIDKTEKILDTVGFGDDLTKITKFETSPFITPASFNIIERINFADTDNNANDFWISTPNPENTKSPTRTPRTDFADIRNLQVENLLADFDSENSKTIIQFSEPNFSFAGINYEYKIFVSTTTPPDPLWSETSDVNILKASSTTIPTPQFASSVFNLEFESINCILDGDSRFNIIVQLQDKIFPQNISQSTSTILNLADYCGEPIQSKDHSRDNPFAGRGIIRISEIKIGSDESTKDEYIEIYNPNPFSIKLDDFSLVKINKNNNEQIIIPQSKFKGTIKPFSFFLLTNELAKQIATLGILPDILWSHSYNLAKENSIKLLDNENNIMDFVSWLNPVYQSLQRKAGVYSTKETLESAVIPFGEKLFGNSFYTGSNDDFVITDSDPQNSSSQEAPPKIPSRLNLTINNPEQGANQSAVLTLDFISPYRYFYYEGTTTYELRVAKSNYTDNEIMSNWDSFPKLDIELPAVRSGGYNEKIEFNPCDKINKDEWLVLAVIEENPIHYLSGIVSFSKIQLLESLYCYRPQNLTLFANHLNKDFGYPAIYEISVKNENENTTARFGVNEHQTDWTTTGYLKLAKNQLFSHSILYGSNTLVPAVDDAFFSFQIIGIKSDNSELQLFSEDWSSKIPAQLAPELKTFQAQIPDENVIKLKVLFRINIGTFRREAFYEEMEITMD